LQPGFKFEFGAIYFIATKLLAFTGHMPFQFRWKYERREETKPQPAAYFFIFIFFANFKNNTPILKHFGYFFSNYEFYLSRCWDWSWRS